MTSPCQIDVYKRQAKYHVTGDYPETTSYGTEVFLAKDGVLIGSIVIADTLKDDAKSAIASLKAQNLHTVMLTGDSETTANAIAKETGIDEVYSRLLPDEKLAKLQEQRSKHGAVMFVGDGINDAPVLAGADCGAAMGSGADAAIEAADVVFMTSNVEAIPQAISIGKKACKMCIRDSYMDLLKNSGHEFDHPEVMIYMIIEMVAGYCYNVILTGEPVSVDELKPYLYQSIRLIIQNHIL